jgi:hypothetical protein
MFGRIVGTVCVIFCWWLFAFVINLPETLIVGKAAGMQFDASDQAYVASQSIFAVFRGVRLIETLAGLIILALIWWRSAKALVVAAMAMTLLCLCAPLPASAYYDKSDYTEAYFILTNESAFYIPDVGDNKSGQANFGSLAYYEQNKIAAKRFVIPHVKLENSGFWSNMYVPAGRLIIVDRTPQSREWVKSAHRGTSKNDQSFPCQSKEGINITVGIAIGVSVQEQDAPKFLYRFGVNNPDGDRTKPEVIFQSVFYGKSLAQVTDGPIRNKVQSIVCDEIVTRTLDEANAQAAQVMKNIETKGRPYLGEYGISLDYIGWADTFEFDPRVQGAIDRRYVANREAEIAAQMAPHTATLQALATAEATRTVADGLRNGKIVLPTSLSIMDFGWLRDVFAAATGQKK